MTRHARDYYPTPSWCLRRLAEVLDLSRLGAPRRPPAPIDGRVLSRDYDRYHPQIQRAWEPGAGRGHLADVLEDYLPGGATLERTDIEPCAEAGVRRLDFLAYRNDHASVAPELIVTNPPYCHADAFVRHALQHVAEGGAVVMLLRITWLGGASEAHPGHWLRAHPPSVYVLPERPCFTGEGVGGDSAPSAWCVWRDELLPEISARFGVLATTPVEERRRDEAAVHHSGLASAQCALFEEAI